VPWWRRLVRRPVIEKLVRDGTGFDVHVISFFEEEVRA